MTVCKMALGETSFRLDIICDLDALALDLPKKRESAELAGRLIAKTSPEMAMIERRLMSIFRTKVDIRFDGHPASWLIHYPGRDQPDLEPSYFGTIARIEGKKPENASVMTFSAAISEEPVNLIVQNEEGVIGVSILVESGQISPDIPLGKAMDPPGSLEIAARYVYLGFWHILPGGLDHILFVLGLFLLCRKWEPLFWQVTAFTLAHTVTLGMSALGFFSLPGRIVEPLIALSIVYVAVENIFVKDLKPHRVVVVFLFGLLHGLGFAGVLGELGLPGRQSTLALFGFNIGVELGQIAVIGIAFALVGRFRTKDFYGPRIVIPTSALIAATGLFWTVMRLL